MLTNPTPAEDGEGVYPHSYERLGAQRGWHVTPVLYDPSPGTATYSVTLQVVCGPKTRHVVPSRRTVYVRPGQTKTATATCPGKRRLFGGGFQRTNFVSRGGNYVTASHAISPKTWLVSGRAFGGFGGELTAIADCRRSGKPLVTEVSATTSGSTLFANGYLNADGSWSAGGYNAFGPPAVLTAYGYCHSRKFPQPDKGKNPHRSVKAPRALRRAEKAAISERVRHGGWYPDPPKLARAIRSRTRLKTGVAPTRRAVRSPGKVYVISRGASCDLARLGIRKGKRVYVINSATGQVKAKRVGA